MVTSRLTLCDQGPDVIMARVWRPPAARSAWRPPAARVGMAASGRPGRHGGLRPPGSAWRPPAARVGMAATGRPGRHAGPGRVGVIHPVASSHRRCLTAGMLPWEAELSGRLDRHVIDSELLRDNVLGDPWQRPLW